KRPSGNVGVKFDADGNPIANFIPLPTITIEKPPANVPVNQPLSFSFKLTDPADPANPGKYMKEGNVLTKLLRADGTGAAGVSRWEASNKTRAPNGQGIEDFSTGLVVTQAGHYQIRALSGLLPLTPSSGELITPTFAVSAGSGALLSSPPDAPG